MRSFDHLIKIITPSNCNNVIEALYQLPLAAGCHINHVQKREYPYSP